MFVVIVIFAAGALLEELAKIPWWVFFVPVGLFLLMIGYGFLKEKWGKLTAQRRRELALAVATLLILAILIWGLPRILNWQKLRGWSSRRIVGMSVATEVCGDNLLFKVWNPTNTTHDSELRVSYASDQFSIGFPFEAGPGETVVEVPIPTETNDPTRWYWVLDVGRHLSHSGSNWAYFGKGYGSAVVCEVVDYKFHFLQNNREAIWRCAGN
ncbi:hypothetical protein L6258_03105 [Candidatus Parcubacteria bacterium]|nr:hypothetical protein [Candidatus Parcubacteria bacterium]